MEDGKMAHRLFTENGFQLNTDASKTLYKSPLQLITRLVSDEGERYTPEKLLKTFEKGVRYSVRVGEARGLVHKVYTIEDVEKNPTIYKGLPLHTEYRVFVDFDTDEVLAVAPYWDPVLMKKKFSGGADNGNVHEIHDYITYLNQKITMFKRLSFIHQKDLVVWIQP